jgi:predicted AAA+ superfamily ATPase
MYKRIFQAPHKSFFLFGPRGTGKTSIIQKLFPRAHWVNLLLEREYQSYLASPELFYNQVTNLKKSSWVVIDEVQRLPSLLNYVHQLIEEKKLKFVLTGSSARKLRRSGTNLLAGRAINRSLFPFIPAELGNDFKINEALRYGTLPLVWSSEDREETLQAYVENYFRQEIKEEALVKNLPGFYRFLKIAALMHGQTLNIANVAREAETARSTVQSFFEILEDTLLGFRLEPYQAKLRIRESKHPKFFLFDPGVVRTLKERKGPVASEEVGPLLEGFILHLIRAEKAYSQFCDEISYWQPAEALFTEVDFLIRRQSSFCGVEVKATTRVRPDDLKGLKAISELKGLKRRVLVYLGNSDQKIEGIEVMTIERFTKELRGGLF